MVKNPQRWLEMGTVYRINLQSTVVTYLSLVIESSDLFESSLSEQMSFDARQSLVRVVIRLLNETKLLSL